VLCTLVFVTFGYVWVPKYGNVLFKKCYYDCGQTKNGKWFDKMMVGPPGATCSKYFAET